MYDRTYWLDHTIDQNGKVVQMGTPMDQVHFNNIEQGLSDVGLAHSIMQFKQIQEDYEYQDELQMVNLEMSGLKWPFNNRETTIALKKMRENINYSVEVQVLAYEGGRLGNIRVTDRAGNGFKLIHDGSATSVQLAVRISGGMTDPMLDENDIE